MTQASEKTRIDITEMTDEEKTQRRVHLRHPKWDWLKPAWRAQATEDPRRRVFATRSMADMIVSQHPEVRDGDVVLDCSQAEVISANFVDQIWNHWPSATFVGLNSDAQASVHMAEARRRR